MPGPEYFVDTNVLLYAVNTNPSEARKTEIARALLKTVNWGWSAQVAAELVRASTSSRQARPLTHSEARGWIEVWMAFSMVSIDGMLVLEALAISERFQISHFDAQILAAAKRMGCVTVYSEDLNHGQGYGGVRVLDPSRATAS